MSWYIINNYQSKKGSHCESTTLKDSINYQDCNLSEERVFRFDLSFRFVFVDLNIHNQLELKANFPYFIEKKQEMMKKDRTQWKIHCMNIKIKAFIMPEVQWNRQKCNIFLDIQTKLFFSIFFRKAKIPTSYPF